MFDMQTKRELFEEKESQSEGNSSKVKTKQRSSSECRKKVRPDQKEEQAETARILKSHWYMG